MQGFRLEPNPLNDLESHDNLLQSTFWAGVKGIDGTRALTFTVASDQGPLKSALSGATCTRVPLLVLIRKLPGPGRGSFAYTPHGPDVALAAEERQLFLVWLSRELTDHLPKGCIFIRYDLPWEIDTPADRNGVLDPPFRRAPVDVQVPDTVIVDLQAGEEEILAKMKSKTRYNIRLSGRKGVTVRKGGREDLDLWYEMARETAHRDRITLHAKSYFETLFLEAENTPGTSVTPLFAEADGEALAALIVTIQGRSATYHFGASKSDKRNYMPTFALQWEAIRYAKTAGCSRYDLLGIPPSDDPKHPLHGLYRVKTGFGGEVIHRAGCWDYPLRKSAYRVLRSAETARNFYYKKMRRRLKSLKIERPR